MCAECGECAAWRVLHGESVRVGCVLRVLRVALTTQHAPWCTNNSKRVAHCTITHKDKTRRRTCGYCRFHFMTLQIMNPQAIHQGMSLKLNKEEIRHHNT